MGKIKVGGKTHGQGRLVEYFQAKLLFKKDHKDRGNVEHARALVKQERTSEFTHVPAAARGQQTLSEPEDVTSEECRLPPPGLPACEV